jgi:hypothetical protein
MENTIENIAPQSNGPSMFLKVLTVLTFIGCAYALYNTSNAYFNSEKVLADLEKAMVDLEEKGGSEMWLESMEKGRQVFEIRNQNKTLFFVVEILGIGLCVFGAIQMRKLKSTGYYLWLAGEFVPILLSIVIIGTSILGIFFIAFLVFPVAFAIMYGTQLKYMS